MDSIGNVLSSEFLTQCKADGARHFLTEFRLKVPKRRLESATDFCAATDSHRERTTVKLFVKNF